MNKENLFRYEAIDKNQEFYTVIQCEDKLVDEVKSIFDKEIILKIYIFTNDRIIVKM